MKTLKELVADLQNNEAFAEKFNDALKVKPEEELRKDPNGAFIAAAAEFGYEVGPEELKELEETQKEVLSEEELGKVAGGTVEWIMTGMAVVATVSLIVSVVDYSLEATSKK